MTARNRHIIAFLMGVAPALFFGLLGLIFSRWTAVPVTLKLLTAQTTFSALGLIFFHPSRRFPNSNWRERICAGLVLAGAAASLGQTFYPGDWATITFYVALAGFTAFCSCYSLLIIVQELESDD
jgi:hypothetical protein